MDLTKFIDSIQQDSIPKNNSIQSLDKWNNLLKAVSKNTSDPKLLMDCIIKFIEYAMGIISLINNYREQIFMSNKYFATIKNVVLDNNLNEVFVQEVTKTTFEIIIDEDSKKLVHKKVPFKNFQQLYCRIRQTYTTNDCQKSTYFFLFKMIDSISTYGDYELQVALIETVFRMYGRNTIHSYLEDLIPESQEISQNFAKITTRNFETDVRVFLNHLNKNSGRIFSISCNVVKMGEIVRRKTEYHPEGCWVDFNLCNGAISWYCTGNTIEFDENEEEFYEIMSLVSDVDNVEIHRDPDSPILVQFTLKNPGITQDENIQRFIDEASSLILIMENNHLGSTLIDRILPKLFGKKFASDKRAINTKVSKSVGYEYQPLGTKVSKHGSITSGLNPTSATTTSSSYPSKIQSEDDIISVQSSLSIEITSVEDDINRIRDIQILSGRCSGSNVNYFNSDSNVPKTSLDKTKQKSPLSENDRLCGILTEKYNTAMEAFSLSQHQKELVISPEMFDTAISKLDSNTNNVVEAHGNSTAKLPTKVSKCYGKSNKKVSSAKAICQNGPKLINSVSSKIKEIVENIKVEIRKASESVENSAESYHTYTDSDAAKNKLYGSHTEKVSHIIEEIEMDHNETQINSTVLESARLIENIDENLTLHQQGNKKRNALTQIDSVIFEDVQFTNDDTINIKTDEDRHDNYVSEKVCISVQNKLKVSKYNKENYSGIHKQTEIGNETKKDES